jgi:hypothetical protein
MSDTNPLHPHTADPVEHDAVSFTGIVWFIVILTLTVVVSQLIVWGMFEWFDYRVTRNDTPRATTAAPASSPIIDGGRVVSGGETTPLPALVVDEPAVLRVYRTQQLEAQTTYGWVDQSMGTVRLPIERAKDLVLERGLPVRPAPAAPSAVPE